MTHLDRLAAQHSLTLHDPDASADAIRAAVDWIEHSPDHLMAMNRVDRFMRACDAIAPRELSALKLSPAARPILSGRGWALAAMAASILFVSISGTFLLPFFSSEPTQAARYASPLGVVRSIRLTDGSNITLAGESAVDVDLRAKSRIVRLVAGEALFAVAPDHNRPFIVQTMNGSTTAVGTAFDVHRGANDTTVTVLHGRVEVLAAGAGYQSRATLDPSMEVRYSNAGEMSAIDRVDPDMIASWRHGEFSYANAPLANVIEDLNRYSGRPIIIEDPRLRTVKISGIVSANGIGEWLGALPAIADVQIVETPRDIRIRPKRERNASQT